MLSRISMEADPREQGSGFVDVPAALAATLALVAAVSGVLSPGIYAGVVLPEFIPGTLSQDIVTVLVALALLVPLPSRQRGSLRDRSLRAGLVGYLCYAYALYAFGNVYTAFYPIYLAVLACGVQSVLAFLFTLDPVALRLPAPTSEPARIRPPRRAVAALFVALIAVFGTLWLTQLIPGVNSRLPPPGATIYVLDFAVVFPLLGIAAVALLQRRRVGDVLAIALLVKAGTLGVSVLLGTVIQPFYGMRPTMLEIGIYVSLSVLPLGLLVLYVRRWEPD